MGISTHVLDTAIGRPAAGVPVSLEHQTENGEWRAVTAGVTDQDGRAMDLSPGAEVEVGDYRLVFAVQEYFSSAGTPAFFREIQLSFEVSDATENYHVPVLVSPFGYTTYRGS